MLVAKFPIHPYPQIGPLLRTSARPGPKDLITCRDHGRHGLVVEPDELRYFTKQKTTCPFLIISVGFTASSCHFCSCFQVLPSNNHFFWINVIIIQPSEKFDHSGIVTSIQFSSFQWCRNVGSSELIQILSHYISQLFNCHWWLNSFFHA